MSELDLAAAVAAARRTADAVADDGSATRRRIRQSLERRRDGRTRRFTITGVIAAMLFGSTAFAYYRKPWRHAAAPPVAVAAPPIVDNVVIENVDIEPPRARERVVVADTPVVVVDTPVVGDKPVVAPSAPAAYGEAPATAPTIEQAPQADPELAAYRVAYDAHFHGGSPAAALAAWDAYLAAYPDGKLAIDARYNRAIILVKLKRYSDATDALRPLASAPEGAYRRAEAARLLQALPH